MISHVGIDDGCNRVDADIRELRSELHTEIGGLRAELRTELGGVETRLRAELGALGPTPAVRSKRSR